MRTTVKVHKVGEVPEGLRDGVCLVGFCAMCHSTRQRRIKKTTSLVNLETVNN